MHLLVDCHLPCTISKPTLSEKDHVQRLRAALAACQTVARRYVSTLALQAENPYSPGDLMLVISTPREKSHKLDQRWQGPFEVTGIPHPTQVQYWRDGSHWIASRRDMKRYYHRSSQQTPARKGGFSPVMDPEKGLPSSIYSRATTFNPVTALTHTPPCPNLPGCTMMPAGHPCSNILT